MSINSIITPTRQIAFYESLIRARKTVLSDRLRDALASLDARVISREIHSVVSNDVLSILASAGIRDEYVFPCATLIKNAPTLVGYYRLLLGLPQKTYYTSKSGMAKFKSAEVEGKINATDYEIEEWCKTMSHALEDLIREISPTLELRDVNDMQIMTLGQQIQGGRNNKIGAAAASAVLQSIGVIVHDYTVNSSSSSISISVPSGKFLIAVASDPDVVIKEIRGSTEYPKIAMEIKGGEDGSNVHNRAGEAEKSHLKTKGNLKYEKCWTIISSAGHSLERLKNESPSTDEWFDVLQIIAQSGLSWNEFEDRIKKLFRIP